MKPNPICEKCNKACSPAGGIVGKGTTHWKCFQCQYEVDDISCVDVETNETYEPVKAKNRLSEIIYFEGRKSIANTIKWSKNIKENFIQ